MSRNSHLWIVPLLIATFLLIKTAAGHDEDLIAMWNKYELTSAPSEFANFRTVSHDLARNKLYVGGVNSVYEFNCLNITHPPRTLRWNPSKDDQDTCLSFKGDDTMLCQNNVGVLQPINNTHLYVCGTMAYSPVCSYIQKENFTFENVEERGKWKTPYDPYVSTVSIIANQTLFTATQDNLQGNNGIISRTLNGVTLRTLEADKYWLNDPVFIGGHHLRFQESLHDKVMIFFREKAEEFQPFQYGLSNNRNARNVVSRVATVCVNDHGGSAWDLNAKFATYQKMTIVCNSRPDSGDVAFRYTHLESTFVLKNEDDPYNPTIYGIFTMPNDALSGTAVCAFTKNDIVSALARNRDYWRRGNGRDGLTTQYEGEVMSGPGMCVPETRELSQSRLTFAAQHPIKFGILYPSYGTPFYQESPARYTHIVVHKIAEEKNSLNQNVTVLFMITEEGRLKRVVIPDNNPTQSWALPDIQAVNLHADERVIKLEIGSKDVFIVTNRSISQVPLAACSLYDGCNSCKNARDPYCALGFDHTCSSVFGLQPDQMHALRNAVIQCMNYTVTPTRAPDGNLVIELQTNMTYLMERNAEAMRNVAALTMDRNRRAEAHGSCSDRLQRQMLRSMELTTRLASVTRNLDTRSENLTSAHYELHKCRQAQGGLADRITFHQEKLKKERRDFQKALQDNRISRNLAMDAVRKCVATKTNLTRHATSCAFSLKAAHRALIGMNRTCSRRKEMEIHALRQQLFALNGKVSALNQVRTRLERERDYNKAKATNQLTLCEKGSDLLSADNSLLQKSAKSLSRRLAEMVRVRKRQDVLVRRLRWLHRQNGHRGQQNCQNTGWFKSNASGSLFLLGTMRVSFENAKSACEALGGRLAIFNNEAELRYISNVIRAYAPRKSFWIGLVKNANRSLTWYNGTPLGRFRSRFPESQRSRMMQRGKLCVEINSYQRWILIPCSRIRRPICQRVRPVRTNGPGLRSTPSYRRLS